MSERIKHVPCDHHRGWGSTGCLFCEDGQAVLNRAELLKVKAENANLKAAIIAWYTTSEKDAIETEEMLGSVAEDLLQESSG